MRGGLERQLVFLVLLAHERERFNLLANIVLHLRLAYRQSVQNGQQA
jgi:hypothetical protein